MIPRTWESEGAGGAAHGGGHEVVEVAVAGVGQLERAHADVVQRLWDRTQHGEGESAIEIGRRLQSRLRDRCTSVGV